MYAFVGRDEEQKRLAAWLERPDDLGADTPIAVIPIQGSAGVGKSYLLQHVKSKVDLRKLGFTYLELTTRGTSEWLSPSRFIARVCASAESQFEGRSWRKIFPKTARVVAFCDSLEDHTRRGIESEGLLGKLSREELLTVARQVHDYKKHLPVKVREWLPNLGPDDVAKVSLAIEKARSSFRSSRMDRFVGRFNPSPEMADIGYELAHAFMADLESLSSSGKAWRSRIGLGLGYTFQRILWEIDDFESLPREVIAFLVDRLIPQLRRGSLSVTVVILTRDILDATHPGWNGQHAMLSDGRELVLHPLTEAEVTELCALAGIHDSATQKRIYQECKGNALYVDWATREAAGGGGVNVKLMRRYVDRVIQWLTPIQREWFWRVVLLDPVNKPGLKQVLADPDDAETVMAWIENERSIIENNNDGVWRIIPFLRDRALHLLSARDPESLQEDLSRIGVDWRDPFFARAADVDRMQRD